MNTQHTLGHIGWSPDYKSQPMPSMTGKLKLDPQNNPVRPLWMKGGKENDWHEDAEHENGQYFNRCLSCDDDFIGHKRRHVCRKCHYEAKAKYDAMTPEERAAFDEKRNAEILAFFATDGLGVAGAKPQPPAEGRK